MPKKEVVDIIKENYKTFEQIVKNELNLSSKHGVLSGGAREARWIAFFRKIIPQKFSIEQGVMIIDSNGNVSKEVDIAVFDNQYTPYLFQYGTLKFIPIEAVAVVVECKSTTWNENGLKDWSESISRLKTANTGISRMVSGYAMQITNTSQPSTRPIKILASMRTNPTEVTLEKNDDYFDFLVYESNEEGRSTIEVKIPNESKSLGWWGKELNGNLNEECNIQAKKNILEDIGKFEYIKTSEIKESKNKKNEPIYSIEIKNTLKDFTIPDNALLSLNFQINQLLMLINNPMLFPHLAYAKLFGAK